MALYIRDREVDALAAELQKVTNASTKTEAVRTALKNEIERNRRQTPLAERLERIIDRSRLLGLPSAADFDMKAFSDELSGESD